MKKLILFLLLLIILGFCQLARGAPVDQWPLVQTIDTVDAAGANAYTQFVVDSLSIGKTRVRSLVNQKIIIRQGTDKPFAVGIYSVAYASPNVTITVNDSVPQAFAHGDSIWFIGDIAYTYVSLPEAAKAAADSTIKRDSASATGTPGTLGSVIKSAGGTGGMTTLPDSLFDSLAAIHAAVNLRPLTTDLPIITHAGLDSLRATPNRIRWISEFIGVPCDSSMQLLFPGGETQVKDSAQIFCWQGGAWTYIRTVTSRYSNVVNAPDTTKTHR